MRLRLLASLPIAIMMTLVLFSSTASLVSAVERSLFEVVDERSSLISIERFELDFFWGPNRASTPGGTLEPRALGSSTHVDPVGPAGPSEAWREGPAGVESDPAIFVF